MVNGEYAWASAPEKEFYKKAVLACLDEPRLSTLLRQRPNVTPEAVVEAMCSSPYVERVLGGPPLPRHDFYRACRRLSDCYFWALPAHPSLREIQHNVGYLPWIAGLFSLCVLPVLLLAAGVPPLVFAVPWLALFGPALVFPRRRPPAPPAPAPNAWLPPVRLALLAPVTCLLWFLESFRGTAWVRELGRSGLQKHTARAVEDLIGEDLGTLLVTSSHEGLRSHHQRAFVIDNRSTAELHRKMDQLADGTIAVSGPRGVGKSTLMQGAVRPRDFFVLAQAPAAYSPHDFLMSVFISVCRQYITRAGHEAPDLVRLSYLHRVRRRAAALLGHLLRPLPYALPAALLIAVGMFAAAREAVEAAGNPWGWRHAVAGFDLAAGLLGDVLGGRAEQAALIIALTGALVWRLRGSTSFARPAQRVGALIVLTTAWGLISAPVVSLLLDPDLQRHFSGLSERPPEGDVTYALPLLCLLVWVCSAMIRSGVSAESWMLSLGTSTVDLKRVLHPLLALLPLVVLVLVVVSPEWRPLLTDDDTPFRLAALLLGLLIHRAVRRPWSLPRTAPALVVACRSHLYRLQTVQNTTATLTTGVTRFLALGGAHTGGLTSVPPNYPLLVAEFRALLGRIAEDEHEKGNRVVIAIDEVDRLGTDAKALEFLAEIKGILGVPHVHYLISVAEDVGAAFVRRGLPHRDVTDSSLDDVLHVRPCALDESERILRKRAKHIGSAYIALAHALSGGIPRDLIRYGRRLVEIQTTRDHVELPDVAWALIPEELSETLTGFRTLLAKQQWQPDTMTVLGSFRSLAAQLRTWCPCPEPAGQLRGALTHFAAYEATGLPEESRRLIEEATAYAYFSLTLLDIFGRPDFNQRRTAAARHPDGQLDLLAEARQELAVSPHSARAVIDGIREAWDLAAVSAQGAQPTVAIPPPRGTACARHPPP
ncbi:hypothetical protein ACFVOK_06595 [Streptomyces sp. NPDC057798]|uniref:hypothetical protein n=1 Tax=Streptomyces sp. NPDC057798 TaxID=3346252 RepID=UPI003684F6D6